VKRLDKDMRNIRLLEKHRDLLREGIKSGGGTVMRQWEDHLPAFWHESLTLHISEHVEDALHYYYSDPFILRPGLDRAKAFVPGVLADATASSIQVSLEDPPVAWQSLYLPGYRQADGVQAPGVIALLVAAAPVVVDLTEAISGFNFRWCRLAWIFIQAAEAMDLELVLDMRGTHI